MEAVAGQAAAISSTAAVKPSAEMPAPPNASGRFRPIIPSAPRLGKWAPTKAAVSSNSATRGANSFWAYRRTVSRTARSSSVKSGIIGDDPRPGKANDPNERGIAWRNYPLLDSHPPQPKDAQYPNRITRFDTRRRTRIANSEEVVRCP